MSRAGDLLKKLLLLLLIFAFLVFTSSFPMWVVLQRVRHQEGLPNSFMRLASSFRAASRKRMTFRFVVPRCIAICLSSHGRSVQMAPNSSGDRLRHAAIS